MPYKGGNSFKTERVSAEKVMSPKKSLRELNLEKQRQRMEEEMNFPGLAAKINHSPYRLHETVKLKSQVVQPAFNASLSST